MVSGFPELVRVPLRCVPNASLWILDTMDSMDTGVSM